MMLGVALLTTAATMLGAIVGAVVHELAHVVAAVGVGGEVRDLGWRGGFTGGPVVVWESPDNTGWEPTIVGFAPVVAAVVAAIAVSVWRPSSGPTIGAAVGLLLGLLNLSREDVDPRTAAEASGQ